MLKKNKFMSSIIHLFFSTLQLVEDRLVYRIYDTNHGSNHFAVETYFVINKPILPYNTGLCLFKDRSKVKMRNKVSSNLTSLALILNKPNLYSTQFTKIVELTISKYILFIKSSPYIKC